MTSLEITVPTDLMIDVVEAHQKAPWFPVPGGPTFIDYVLAPDTDWAMVEDPNKMVDYRRVRVWSKPVPFKAEDTIVYGIRYECEGVGFYYVPEHGVFMVTVQD